MICCYSRYVSDFELMMQKKKNDQGSRRKRGSNVDIINDNDDLIAELIGQMKQAAEVSCFILFLSPLGAEQHLPVLIITVWNCLDQWCSTCVRLNPRGLVSQSQGFVGSLPKRIANLL